MSTWEAALEREYQTAMETDELYGVTLERRGREIDIVRVTHPDGWYSLIDTDGTRPVSDLIAESIAIRTRESSPDDPTINPATGLHYYGSPQWDKYDEYQTMDDEERLYHYGSTAY